MAPTFSTRIQERNLIQLDPPQWQKKKISLILKFSFPTYRPHQFSLSYNQQLLFAKGYGEAIKRNGSNTVVIQAQRWHFPNQQRRFIKSRILSSVTF